MQFEVPLFAVCSFDTFISLKQLSSVLTLDQGPVEMILELSPTSTTAVGSLSFPALGEISHYFVQEGPCRWRKVGSSSGFGCESPFTWALFGCILLSLIIVDII